MTAAFVDLARRIAAIVGEANVLTADADVARYVVDWRGRYRGRALCVARPAATAEVAALVRACAEARVPIVPQGGNTGQCGAATPDDSGRSVVVSLERMDRIRAVDTVGNTLTVEAGCVLARVLEAARAADRLFPMGLGSEGSCQIGGTISTNAGGTAVLRYGPMRSLVLGLEVVLPDGRVLDALRPLYKDNTGFDLKHLFIGAEGTLGIVTAAVLRLFPAPKASATALAGLRSPAEALRLLARLRAECGERLTAYEILSETQMAMVEDALPGLACPLPSRAPWYQIVELTDTREDGDLRGLAERVLAGALEEGLVTDAVLAMHPAQAASIWRLRHAVSEANRVGGVGLSHDTSVPLPAIPEFIERVGAEIGAAYPDARCLYVGHIGDGNIHVVAHFPRERFRDDLEFQAAAARVNDIVFRVTAALGGSISAEHGIGLSLRPALPAYKSAVELDLMRRIKSLLDPDGIMNPGKLL